MIAVFGIAWLWKRNAVTNVIYKRNIYYRRAFPDEKVNNVLEVENRKLLPLGWLVTEDRWPYAVSPEDEDIQQLTIKLVKRLGPIALRRLEEAGQQDAWQPSEDTQHHTLIGEALRLPFAGGIKWDDWPVPYMVLLRNRSKCTTMCTTTCCVHSSAMYPHVVVVQMVCMERLQ